jgi:multidrug efflux pump subunit AcrA (membrane-fusion protein)
MILRRKFGFIMPALLLGGMVEGCSRSSAPAAATPLESVAEIEVTALQVQPEKISRTVQLIGTLEGEREVTVSSEVAGRVMAVVADLGDRVEKDQPIVELDSREFRLAVERQEAALAQVLAQLGVAKGSDPLPEPSSTSTVRRAMADLTETRVQFERTKSLYEKGVTAKSVYDSAEARLHASEANYTAAVEQIRNLIAQVDNLKTQLVLAQKKLSDCTVRAPFAGTVRTRLVELGQYVKDQTPLISLASVNALKLRASVPERWFPFVAVGAPLELSVEAYQDKFAGKVARVSGAIDPQSRTFPIEGRIDNAQGKLRPGLFVAAMLTTSKVDSVLRVPASAVISFYGVQKVFLAEKDGVREQVVKLGDRQGDLIEITEGVTPGSWIVISELARVRQGSRIRVKREG